MLEFHTYMWNSNIVHVVVSYDVPQKGRTFEITLGVGGKLILRGEGA